MSANRYPLDLIRQRQIPWRTPGICPLAVSNKLKAIRELREPKLAEQLNDEPRLAELLWFLQWRSHQPGGLDKFVQEFLLEFPECIHTRQMAEIPRPRSGCYSLEECVHLWGSLPKNKKTPWDNGLGHGEPGHATSSAAERLTLCELNEHRLLNCASDIAYLLEGDTSELRKIDLATHRNAARLVATLTPDFFFKECADEALHKLPGYLAALCVELGPGFGEGGVWYFDGLIAALLEGMDRHATKARAAIAKTTVSETVFDKLEFAIGMRANVLLAGDARLGKSVTLEAESRMRPGQCRLVTIPNETGEREFMEAHAKALHWSYDSKTPTNELKSAVKHIVAHSGLFLAYDEFHFAVPSRPRRNGSPPRLDWIRCNVVDRKLGVVFCTTRQGYGRALSEFMKDTKWAIEQWAGRLHDVTLFGSDADDSAAAPALNPDDILAIAAQKFPDVDNAVLEEIASEAYDTNTAPHTVEAILLQACWLARKAGRSTPTEADARLAIQEWKRQPAHEAFERRSGPPAIPPPVVAPLPEVPSVSVQAPRSPAAAGLPRRGQTPALPLDEPTSSRAASRHALETV